MKKKIVAIMGITLAVVAICVSVALLTGNSDKGADSWQKQYDLGVRYLSEGNYEEAIIAFAAAIEIDPKNAKIYERMAEAYIALGDIDSARDILEQGADATGEDFLRNRLEDLQQKNGLVVSSNNLNISNLRCYFVADHEILEYNKDAVGGMDIDFVVDGPSDVRKVYISIWYPFLPDHEQITEDIANEVEFWKRYEFAEDNRIPPFDEGLAHPVYQEDLGGTFYVILVGVNENCDAIGYAIVQEIVSTDGATGEDLNNVQVESKSLLEKDASANMINIDDITFCGCKISSMDFSTLTSMDYISMMKDEGFSEENENVNSTELWTVKGWQDHDEKWGKYTGYGDASVSVERNSDVIRFSTNCSSTYYGEKQLSIGIKDIYIGSSFKEVLNGLGFENTAEFSERFHEVFSETKSIGDDAVEEKLDMMVHYNGDSFRIGNVWVEPDNWKLTLFVDNVDNADFYTLTFHFGAYGAAIRVYDDSIGKYRKWSEYQDCLTWFEITVFK